MSNQLPTKPTPPPAAPLGVVAQPGEIIIPDRPELMGSAAYRRYHEKMTVLLK